MCQCSRISRISLKQKVYCVTSFQLDTLFVVLFSHRPELVTILITFALVFFVLTLVQTLR